MKEAKREQEGRNKSTYITNHNKCKQVKLTVKRQGFQVRFKI